MSYLAAPDARVTDAFTIRSYMPGDGPLLREATNASFEHLEPFMPWATADQTEEEAERLVRQFRGRYLLATDFVLALVAPDGSELWGGGGFHLREGGLDAGSAEMGMWVRAGREGRGLGTAFLKELIAWGFTDWPFVRLAWRCDTKNVASIRVAERAGMRREGTLSSHMFSPQGERRDTACFAILRDDWTA